MTFPTVEATATSEHSTTVSSHTVSLPASIASGDLLIVFFGYAVANGTVTVGWPNEGTDWIELFQVEQATGGNTGLSVAWRDADGGEGASITVTSAVTTRSTHVAYRISGAEDPSTQAPEYTTSVGSNQDPFETAASLTPTGGAADFLWLAGGSSSHGGDDPAASDYTAYSTSYTGGFLANNTGTISGSRCITGSARRELNASSESPSQWTHTESAIAECVSATVAIHPGGAAADLSVNISPAASFIKIV